MNTAAATQVGVKHLDHLNMTVTDLAESLDWYRRVLDFEKVEDGLYQGHPWASIRSGDAMLCLYERPDFKRAEHAGAIHLHQNVLSEVVGEVHSRRPL